jgi:uncharacterized Tic20 family protein
MTPATDPESSPQTAAPSHEERTSAMLAHVLSIFTGFVGPSVIYFAKRRESRFVAFHAKQAMVWHLGLFVAMFGGIAIAMALLLSGAFGPPRVPSPGVHASAPFVPFLLFSVVWIFAMVVWFVSVGYAVYLSMQASSGRWARYPLVGRLVARLEN